MCYKLRKHEDSIGEISARRPWVGKHLDQDGDIGGGSHRLEGVTGHQERVRPVKERVGSSACNGNGEGGANDVHATSILGSRLGRASSITTQRPAWWWRWPCKVTIMTWA